MCQSVHLVNLGEPGWKYPLACWDQGLRFPAKTLCGSIPPTPRRGKGYGTAGIQGYIEPGLNPWITGSWVGRKSHSETRGFALDPPTLSDP